MQCLCRLLSAGGYARIRTKWCPSGSVCHDDSVNVFRAPPEAFFITGTARGICGSAWIGKNIVHAGEDAGGRQIFPIVPDWPYFELMVLPDRGVPWLFL